METRITYNNDIKYVNLGYILSQISQTNTIRDKNVNQLKKNLEGLIPHSNIKLFVVDMDNITTVYNSVEGKSSYLKYVFEDIEKYEFIESILFVNCSEEIVGFLRDKDFSYSSKVFVLSYEFGAEYLQSSKNVSNDDIKKKIKEIIFDSDAAVENKDAYLGFVSGLFSKRIKEVLSENNCIEPLVEIGKHILSSTPVHVNKYVNLKPVLEMHSYFQEVCYLLYRQIVKTCSTPDFIVASSRNSIYIASGLLKYFKTADMIILDQISPVTKLSNFSNLEDINPKRTYAIIEDFCCMGTEIKTVKSVLWSRGVDVDQDCYVFPVVSTNLYGNKTKDNFKSHRIFPLHILEESEKYLMFTYNCCPVCNEIHCQHSEEFNFKK